MTAPAPGVSDDSTDPPPAWPFDPALVKAAEYACVGELLRHPQGIQELALCLHAADFAYPEVGTVYAALEQLHAAGKLNTNGTDRAVDENYVTIKNALAATDAERTGQFGRLLTDLVTACPRSSEPLHQVYGRMTLEMSVRRRLSEWALLWNAVVPAEIAAGDVRTAESLYAEFTQDLERLESSLTTPIFSVIDRKLDPQSLLQHGVSQPPPGPTLLRKSEQTLIAAVLTDPQPHHSPLLRRFDPEDFTAEATHANTWRAIKGLSNSSQPINWLTVPWEQAKLADRYGAGLSTALLRDLSTRAPQIYQNHVQTVAHAALHHHTMTAVQCLREAAQAPSGPSVPHAQQAGHIWHQHARRLAGAPPATSLAQLLDTPSPAQSRSR